MGNLVSGSNYTINSLIGEKNTQYTLSGAIATNGAKGFIEYSSNIYFQQESGGIFIAAPALNPAPTVDVSTITFAGYASSGQVISQSLASNGGMSGPTLPKLYINTTASAGLYDFLTYGGEIRMVTDATFGVVQDALFSAYQLTLNDSFTTNTIAKVIGTDITVTTGAAPVSGSTYEIVEYDGKDQNEDGGPYNITLKNVNPSLWPDKGIYIQYSGSQYWLSKGSFAIGAHSSFRINSEYGFTTAPVVGNDILTYFKDPAVNEVVEENLGLLTIGTSSAYPFYNYTGYKLNYNAESRYITSYYTNQLNNIFIDIDSAFTTSPVGKLLGTEITLGDAPVNGQIVEYVVGDTYMLAVTGSPAINNGDQLTYLGETVTITSTFPSFEFPQFNVINVDIGFSNNTLGKVLGVDITITAAPPTGKRLIPPPGERTVPENDLLPEVRSVPEDDLTPDVRDVSRTELVPNVINKGGLIPS